MKLKNLLPLFSILLLFSCAGTRNVVSDVPIQPKREFRGAWIQAVNGQFTGMSEQQMKQYLVNMLDSLQLVNVNAITPT